MRLGRILIGWQLLALPLMAGVAGCAAVREELGISTSPMNDSWGAQAEQPMAVSQSRYESQAPALQRYEPAPAHAYESTAAKSSGGMGQPYAAHADGHALPSSGLPPASSGALMPEPAVISAPKVETVVSAPMAYTPAPAGGHGGDGHGGGHGAPMAGAAPSAAHASHAHWSYEGASGPQQWGSLDDDYRLCKLGRNQSPIDIPASLLVQPSSLTVQYPPIPLTVVNNGHTIQVNNSVDASILLDGERFNLLQFHFHTPSEHTLAGRSFPLELHFVHKNAAGQLAVVGLFFEEGMENPILGKIWETVPPENQTRTAAGVALDMASMISLDRGFVRYAGSLTTPPCSEGVRWIVLNTPHVASRQQVEAFMRVFPMNARPVQFLLGRKITRNQ